MNLKKLKTLINKQKRIYDHTWCPVPWTSQHIRSNGDIAVCCHASASKTCGILKKENGKNYNVAKDNLSQARNSPTLKKIRLKMLKGEKPEECVRCHREESNNMRSRRLWETANYQPFFSFEKAFQNTDQKGYINPLKNPIVQYDLRFGNRCNLKCRMCGPINSDLWYSDFVEVWGEKSFKDSHDFVQLIQKKNGLYQTKNKDYDWMDSPHFWKQLKSNIQNTQVIYTVGGEPLLIDKHYELLRMLIEKGQSENVTIEYNSNLTILPNKALKLWKRFKKINIGVSLDGIGPINDYIRYPSRFKKIEKNLDTLDKSEGNFRIWIATTVQAYNIYHLTDFIYWKLKKHFQNVNSLQTNKPILNLQPLHDPDFLNVKILPKAYKNQVKEKFHNFLLSLEEITKEEGYSEKESLKIQQASKQLLDSYTSYMDSEDWSHLLPKFMKFTKSLDQIRNQNLKDVLPELYRSLS